MRFRSYNAARDEPRTVTGQVVRAVFLREYALARQLGERTNRGVDGWNYDEAGLMQIICELAVRRYFPTSVDVREITAFVSEMRERILQNGPAPGQLEVEAVIRSALGEGDVSVRGIGLEALLEIRGVVIVNILNKLGMDKSGADSLIAQGERLALRRGWNPPLVEG